MGDLMTLQQLAEILGLTYKALYNRLNQKSGEIRVAGRVIQAIKDRGQWFVWQTDYEASAVRSEQQRPLLKPPQAAPTTRKKTRGKVEFFINR